MNILKLNTKPRAGPFIIERGRTFSYIIFGPTGPLNWADVDQILCDTGHESAQTDGQTEWFLYTPNFVHKGYKNSYFSYLCNSTVIRQTESIACVCGCVCVCVCNGFFLGPPWKNFLDPCLKYYVLPGPHQSGRRTDNPETFLVWLFL